MERIREGVFDFLNQEIDLGRPVRWVPEEVDRLWHYQLHAFEYVVPLGLRFQRSASKEDYGIFRELVDDWLQASPVGAEPAWDPYPTSLRIRNWLQAYSLFDSAIQQDSAFAQRFLEGLYSQARYLERFVEYHLLGNHLIENGRALLMAGLFFQDRRARRWRRKGAGILWREIDRQFLSDGAHFERSPMYHRLMLRLYQDAVGVLTALGRPVPPGIGARLEKMEAWLATVLHPDGEIPLLNDSVIGDARKAKAAVEAGENGASSLEPLPESGYFVFRNPRKQDFVIFDCGPIGPDYQPGHGHCDCLSYELSVSGHRIIVDSGVGTYYGDLARRNYYRSTRAHNTIQIDGEEQSEIWDRFRVGRRAYPLGVRWRNGKDIAWVTGAHTGYRRLSGRVTHRRWFCWIDRRFWLVCDRLTGSGRHRVESFLHFHPEAEVDKPVRQNGHFAAQIRRQEAALSIVLWGAGEVRTDDEETNAPQSWYAPGFNREIANPVWCLYSEVDLPAWSAQVLWPGGNHVEAQFLEESKEAFRVEVQGGGASYRVFCDGRTMELER